MASLKGCSCRLYGIQTSRDKRPLAVDGPQGPHVNGRSRECESCPATSFMVRDLEKQKQKFLRPKVCLKIVITIRERKQF